MDKKIGVYFCKGCDIGASLDVGKLKETAAGDMKAHVCREHDALCSPDGAALIRNDIGAEGVNTVVVCACSQREKTDVFDYDPLSIVTERVNLREHVVWCHDPGDEDTQALADDCVRIGITKAQIAEPPAPFAEEIDRTILVVGGGVAGLTAALESARAGYNVALVEKEHAPGGWNAKAAAQIPLSQPYTDLVKPIAGKLVSEVEAEPKIRLYAGNEVRHCTGAPGMFDVTLKNGENFRAGAIVLASGAIPYDPGRLSHLGYGKSPDVITSADLERMCAAGRIARPSDGRAPGRV
ncbi:MAG: FAD-dependent oxidoreductase, partial [bacterium]